MRRGVPCNLSQHKRRAVIAAHGGPVHGSGRNVNSAHCHSGNQPWDLRQDQRRANQPKCRKDRHALLVTCREQPRQPALQPARCTLYNPARVRVKRSIVRRSARRRRQRRACRTFSLRRSTTMLAGTERSPRCSSNTCIVSAQPLAHVLQNGDSRPAWTFTRRLPLSCNRYRTTLSLPYMQDAWNAASFFACTFTARSPCNANSVCATSSCPCSQAFRNAYSSVACTSMRRSPSRASNNRTTCRAPCAQASTNTFEGTFTRCLRVRDSKKSTTSHLLCLQASRSASPWPTCTFGRRVRFCVNNSRTTSTCPFAHAD